MPEADPLDSDEDWEYEYDETETEDFYFTLDLTNHDINALQTKEKAPNGQTKPVDATNASNLNHKGNRDASNPHSINPAADENAQPEESQSIQILDLHTSNPYIKYGSSTYSCYWMSDLGSQFYVSRPGIVEEPLRPGNVIDVIALSRTRLVGKPITLRQRPGFRETPVQGSTSSDAIAIDDDDNETTIGPDVSISDYGPGKRLVVPRELITDSSSEAQASFLERLSAIKLKKGETDIVPTNAIRYYNPPANQDEIRERALKADALRATKAAQETIDRSAKRRRVQTEQSVEPEQPDDGEDEEHTSV